MPAAPPTAARPRNLQQEVGKRRPFDLPEEEAYLNLIRTAEQLSGQVRALFAEHGLSEPLYNALRIVAARGKGGLPSQSIAGDMVSRDPDVTRLVDRLAEAGYVTRTRSDADRRVVVVTITDAGRAALRRLARPLADLHRQSLGHLGPDRLRRLSRLLFDARHPD